MVKQKRPAAIVFLIVVAVVALTLVKAYEQVPEFAETARRMIRKTLAWSGALAAVAGVVAAYVFGAPALVALAVAGAAFTVTGGYSITAGVFGLPQLPGGSNNTSDGCPPGWQVGSGGIGCVQVER